jgi:hypothetical protein
MLLLFLQPNFALLGLEQRAPPIVRRSWSYASQEWKPIGSERVPQLPNPAIHDPGDLLCHQQWRLDLKRRETQMGKTSSLRVSGRGGDFSGRLAKGPNTKFSPIEPLCPLKECTERTDRPARRRGLRGIQRLRWNMSATEPRPSDCAKAMYMKSDPVRHDCMLGGLDGSTVISIRGCASATFGPNAKARERRAIFR